MRIRSFIICFLCLQSIYGQMGLKNPSYFLKSFQIGTSVTYIWEKNAYTSDDFYGETTWNVNFATRLSKRFWLGVQAAPIFFKERFGTLSSKRINYFTGVFTQFDFVNKNGLRIYAETSINSANYCTCGDLNPTTVDGLFTWGGGAGIEFSLNSKTKNNLKLELGLFNYVILNDIKFKYNFTQYIFGLNYVFGEI